MTAKGDIASEFDSGRAAAPGPARMVSAGLETSLERFDDPALLGSGKVNIIALDAVVARFGRRWPLRRDQVYDHVDRTLQRHLGLQGYYLRVSETDFLICQPELSRFAGQASCLRFLREILSHFLGEAHLADSGVHQVTKISASAVEAQRVNASQAEAEEKAEARLEEQIEPAVEDQSPPTHPSSEPTPQARPERPRPLRSGTVDRWTPFVASDGRELRVSCTLEPVFELKTYRRIGFRMARRVLLKATDEELTPAALAKLSSPDMLRIDLATIARGLGRVDADVSEDQLPSLILPVSYATLSNRRARADVVTAFKDASALVKQGVICEITEIEGVPQGALLAVVSLIKPFALLVVGRLETTPPPNGVISLLQDAGLQGLSFECPPTQGEAEFIGWAKATIEAAKHVAKSVLVYRNTSARNAGLASLMGATHASVRAPLQGEAPAAAPQPPVKS